MYILKYNAKTQKRSIADLLVTEHSLAARLPLLNALLAFALLGISHLVQRSSIVEEVADKDATVDRPSDAKGHARSTPPAVPRHVVGVEHDGEGVAGSEDQPEAGDDSLGPEAEIDRVGSVMKDVF